IQIIVWIFFVNKLEDAFSTLTPVELREKYGREKPYKDFNMTFLCRSGRRSGIAQEKAAGLGYKNYCVQLYGQLVGLGGT
ncbi:hypothetical protein NQ318_010924, partial [Aromia moschata]